MAGDPRIQGFNADVVRSGLRLAMQVGLPVDASDQPTFFLPRTFTASENTDGEGVPYDAAYNPTYTRAAGVKVPCAVEYVDGEGKLTGFGIVAPTKVILTLLDQDYARVEGFEFVVIRGVKFYYRRTETPRGLVTVGLFRLHCQSEDEG